MNTHSKPQFPYRNTYPIIDEETGREMLVIQQIWQHWHDCYVTTGESANDFDFLVWVSRRLELWANTHET